MITKTTETAFRILLFLNQQGGGRPVTLAELSDSLGGSSSYLAKIAHLLVRGGVIDSHRGVQGGFSLAPHTLGINLLRVVEVCQGFPEAAYCASKVTPGVQVCGYHEVMAKLHRAIVETLESKTVSDLTTCPRGLDGGGRKIEPCRMCVDRDCHRDPEDAEKKGLVLPFS